MAILRMRELGGMDANSISDKLGELKRELSLERGSAAGVGRTANPGRIRAIKRTVARMLTFARSKNMKVEARLGKGASTAPAKAASKTAAAQAQEPKPAAKSVQEQAPKTEVRGSNTLAKTAASISTDKHARNKI